LKPPDISIIENKAKGQVKKAHWQEGEEEGFVAGACGAICPLFITQRAQRRQERQGKREGERVIVSEIIVNRINPEVQR
jgi:hypothetical protein